MTRVYVGMQAALLVADDAGGTWRATTHFAGSTVEAIALDPAKPGRVYAGMYSGQEMHGEVARGSEGGLRGVWRSDDGGDTWHDVSAGLPHPAIVSLAVGPGAASGDGGVVYAGGEPSTLARSTDGGKAWQPCGAMTGLPSAPEWAFPPRPHTHHVRQIGVDPADANRLYACIENGALIRSDNGGRTWRDRVPGGPHDTHTFATHPQAPGRLYAAAGDGFIRPGTGYAESHDGGDTWTHPDEGLRHHYLFGMAVDSQDPDTVLISASSSPEAAHNPMAAESHVYRRTGDAPWQPVTAGLPAPKGTVITMFGAHPSRGGEFYAANNGGVFRSADGGRSWQSLPLPWPPHYRYMHVQWVAVAE